MIGKTFSVTKPVTGLRTGTLMIGDDVRLPTASLLVAITFVFGELTLLVEGVFGAAVTGSVFVLAGANGLEVAVALVWVGADLESDLTGALSVFDGDSGWGWG